MLRSGSFGINAHHLDQENSFPKLHLHKRDYRVNFTGFLWELCQTILGTCMLQIIVGSSSSSSDHKRLNTGPAHEKYSEIVSPLHSGACSLLFLSEIEV